MVSRVDTAPHSVKTPNRGSESQSHPRRTRFHPRIRNPSTYLHFQQTGDENGGPQGRYRPARCGSPNLGFIEPAPPGEDKLASPDQKSFHTSTTLMNRGRKPWSPGPIPFRAVWKPQAQSLDNICLLYTSPSPRDRQKSRMPSSA